MEDVISCCVGLPVPRCQAREAVGGSGLRTPVRSSHHVSTHPKHSPKHPPGSPIHALPPLRCSLRWPQRRLQKLLDLQRVRLDIPIIEQDGQLRAWREVLQHIQCPVDTRQKGGGWPEVGRSQGGVQGCVSPSCVHCGECEGHTFEE